MLSRRAAFLDPSQPIAIQPDDTKRNPVRTKAKFKGCYRLPTEIYTTILEYLDTESLVHFFAACDDHMSMTIQFAQLRPGLFYPTNDHPAMPLLIYAISNSFSKTDFASLSRRWKVVDTIMASARDVQLIRNNLTIRTSPSIGCHRSTVKVAGLDTITIYYRKFHHKHYVCGIHFHYSNTVVIAGEESKTSFSQSTSGVKEIRFLIDAFGVRDLQLDWKSFCMTNPQLPCWEGLLQLDRSENLQIATDVRLPVKLLA